MQIKPTIGASPNHTRMPVNKAIERSKNDPVNTTGSFFYQLN
jgi:hypothetical protein